MKRRFRGPLLFLLIGAIPAMVVALGAIDDVRYKMKSADGDLWASLLGSGKVVRGNEAPNTIAFTFDDGPDHRTTPILLDQLDRYGIKAAFFINGARFHPRTAGGPENQAVLRDIYRRGHFLGNHTFNHKDITFLTTDEWRTEVVQLEQVLMSVTGERPWLFRPPFGKADEDAFLRLTKAGYTPVMWNLDSMDWRINSAKELLAESQKTILANPTGGVFLMHDTNRTTIETFPLIIEWIEQRNEQLRAEGKPILKIVGIDRYITRR